MMRKQLKDIGHLFFVLKKQGWSLFILILMLSALSSCQKKETPAGNIIVKKPPLVRVMPAAMGKLTSFLEIAGTVEANLFTEVKSPADGIIELLAARENQQVVKDRIIAVINPNDRVALITTHQMKIEQLERKMTTVEKESEAGISLAAELEMAKNNLEYARSMYQTIPVICPMSGVVTSRWLDEGSQVGSKERIITISDMHSLVVKAEINETYFGAVKRGGRFPVSLSAYPGDTIMGMVSLIYPRVDQETRSLKFDLKLLNFGKAILPGMMATIKIPVSIKEEAVYVPEESVLTSPDNRKFLFVVDQDSIAHRRVVKTGITSGNKLEISGGLVVNERVVIEGQEMLKDSMRVMLAENPKGSQK